MKVEPSRQGLLRLILLVVLAGCDSKGDTAFRETAPRVLREAAALDSGIVQRIPRTPAGQFGFDHHDVESEEARAMALSRDFATHTESLPVPQKRPWRYLRSKLVKLGVAATDLTRAEGWAHRVMAPYGIPSDTFNGHLRRIHDFARWEGAARARYLEALLDATAAERVALRTAILPESHPPDWVSGDSVGVSWGWTREELAARVRAASRESRMVQ